MTEINLETKLARNDAILFSDVADGTTLMDIDSGEYFHYEAVGARIWDLIDGQRTVAEICTALQEEFEVDGATCQADTLAFLSRLSELKHVGLSE